MTFEDLLQAVDQLTDEERQRLQMYLSQPKHPDIAVLSAEERTKKLIAVLDALREGLSEEEIKEITDAMTEDYIEPWDESEWTE
ncbi:MAG: hypothetical protein AAFR81_30225 [Chloroflexota bacterium]